MNTLTFPYPLFQRLVQAFAEDRQRAAFVRVGTHSSRNDCTWLVRAVLFAPPNSSTQEPVFQIALGVPPPSDAPLLFDFVVPGAVGVCWLDDGPLRGRLWGVVRNGDKVEPLHRLVLVGAGMHTLPVSLLSEPALHLDVPNSAIDLRSSRWSRTLGALGGAAVWQRLTGLRIALIGCGRTGSLVAHTLARLGVHQLTLIDPDCLEAHNLGEMDLVTDADLGQLKVVALAEHLRWEIGEPSIFRLRSRYAQGERKKEHRSRERFPDTEEAWEYVGEFSSPPLAIDCISAPVTAESALTACKQAEVLFCCVDNDAARLAAALVATLYHKVLIDIGTGVQFSQSTEASTEPPITPPQRQMGADVRLIVPGSGCLLCVGHLHRYQQAVEALCRGSLTTFQHEEWWQQRAGSLRSLNQMAAHLAVHMLQDLAAERIQTSLWTQLEFDDTGRLTVRYPPLQRTTDSPSCILCAKAGLGDDGLGWGR